MNSECTIPEKLIVSDKAVNKLAMPRSSFMAIMAALSLGGYAATAVGQQSGGNFMFTSTGFQVRYADTPEKLAHLRRLPPDQFVVRKRNGRTYYVYADPTNCRCAYVGTPEAYQNYKTTYDPSQIPGGGVSIEDQMVNEMTEEDTPTEPGAPSFNDYVFGGMRND
jgi:hypothetical protein